MSIDKEKQDLIIKYIQNRLSIEEKMEVFNYTLAEPEFRQELKEELELAEKIKKSSIKLNSDVKDKIYKNIRLKAAKKNLSAEIIENVITDWLFDLTLPRVTLPILNLIKRR